MGSTMIDVFAPGLLKAFICDFLYVLYFICVYVYLSYMCTVCLKGQANIQFPKLM